MSAIPTSALAEELERQSVVLVECSIPAHMTINQWRASRAGDRRPPGRRWRLASRSRPS
jgi:hypothetical protein